MQISAQLCGWCHHQSFGFYDLGSTFENPGLLGADELHLTKGGKSLHQQAGQAYKKSFKLDRTREGDGVLGNREEAGAVNVLGSNSETPWNCFKGIRVCSFIKVTWLTA